MLRVTSDAAEVVKAAKAAQTPEPNAGIRIVRASSEEGSERIGIGFAISLGPADGDVEIEQEGLRIFVDSDLVEPLEGRTLDVRDEGQEGPEPELIFR
jgi:Fe-S cluster assembly iron-binding protein IscA